MDVLDGLDLALEGRDEGVGQDGGAVIFTFSIADDDLMIAEVNILDAQAHTFHQAQAAAIEQFCHELRQAGHFGDDGHGFLVGEDDGEGLGFFGADGIRGDIHLDVKNVAVEEEDSAEGLVLGGGGDMTLDGEMCDEGLDLIGAHVFGVAFIMKEDVAFDPVLVGLFGAVGVVFGADGVAHLIEQFAGRGFDGRGLHFIDLLGRDGYNAFILIITHSV